MKLTHAALAALALLLTPISHSQTPKLESADKSKAVGDALQDLVYTPVTPCRLFDSRAGQASALGQLDGVMTAQSRRTLNAGGQCGIPATGVASVFISFHAYNNAPATLGIISFMKPGDALTAMAATWTGSNWATGTFIAGTNESGAFDVFVGNPAPAMTADMVVDVMGYFMAPSRVGNGMRVTLIPDGFGQGKSATNVVNGDANNTVAKTCVAGISNASCSTDPTGLVSATISGGNGNRVTDYGGTIGGGVDNLVGDDNDNPLTAIHATIGGGIRNIASGTRSTVSGGGQNSATGYHSTVGGGVGNRASGVGSTVSGGTANIAEGFGSSVLGGYGGEAIGMYSTVVGGVNNKSSGDLNFVAGHQASTQSYGVPVRDFYGSFVWADAGEPLMLPTGLTYGNNRFHASASNQFAVRARGGVVFKLVGSSSAGDDSYQGCALPAGGAASWSCSSDRTLKEAIQAISPQTMLNKVLALPVTSWQFIGTNRRHIGPMAQDFRAAFGLGADDKNITTSDVSGVALAAIQGLNQKLEAEKAKNKAKESEIAALKADLSLIKKKLGL